MICLNISFVKLFIFFCFFYFFRKKIFFDKFVVLIIIFATFNAAFCVTPNVGFVKFYKRNFELL